MTNNKIKEQQLDDEQLVQMQFAQTDALKRIADALERIATSSALQLDDTKLLINAIRSLNLR